MSQQKDDYTWMYIVGALLVGAAIWYFLSSTASGYVTVKYRDDKVNVETDNFEPLGSSDSTVGGAWYDSSNEYLVIKLSSTYYHYCGMPSSVWSGLKSSGSPYSYYQDEIKGDYDCRVNPVPEYAS